MSSRVDNLKTVRDVQLSTIVDGTICGCVAFQVAHSTATPKPSHLVVIRQTSTVGGATHEDVGAEYLSAGFVRTACVQNLL